MERTVFAFARTRKGIIAVRTAGETQWHFLEIDVPHGADWRDAASRGFEAATSVPSSPKDWDLVVSHVDDSKGRKREILYVEIRIADSEIHESLPRRGRDGHQVKEVSYWKAENSYSLRKEERDFLEVHDLLGPF